MINVGFKPVENRAVNAKPGWKLVYGIKGSSEIKDQRKESFYEPIALMRWSSLLFHL